MRIVNTLPEIEAAFMNKPFARDTWRHYAAGISPSLPAKCEEDAKDYDFARDVIPVIEAAMKRPDKLAVLNGSFSAAVRLLKENLHDLFDGEPDITIVLYLGLCNGAGWATSLEGKDAVLLGVEKIIELDWQNEMDMKGLLFHEVGHIWHRHAGRTDHQEGSLRERGVLQLYDEGIAMVSEQLLCADDGFYNQDKGGWLSWCRGNMEMIKAEYLYRLENDGSTQDFFGDWCAFMGRSDVGYFLGCAFVRHLMERFSLKDVAALPYPAIERELLMFLAGQGRQE